MAPRRSVVPWRPARPVVVGNGCDARGLGIPFVAKPAPDGTDPRPAANRISGGSGELLRGLAMLLAGLDECW